MSSATGVAQIFVETSEGSSICSGTLLNNRQQDLTPYFLTAAHCVATEEEARSVIAFWHYQTQTCNGDLPDFQSVPRTEGARLLSTLDGGPVDGRSNPGGDMTLLRLEGDLPDGVMFQGWDADPQPVGAQVTSIHHPEAIGAFSSGFPSVRSFPTRVLELPTMSTPSSPGHRDKATRGRDLPGPPSLAVLEP